MRLIVAPLISMSLDGCSICYLLPVYTHRNKGDKSSLYSEPTTYMVNLWNQCFPNKWYRLNLWLGAKMFICGRRLFKGICRNRVDVERLGLLPMNNILIPMDGFTQCCFWVAQWWVNYICLFLYFLTVFLTSCGNKVNSPDGLRRWYKVIALYVFGWDAKN